MLGGGLVSFSTLSPGCITALNKLNTGVVIATYAFRPEDIVVEDASAGDASGTESATATAVVTVAPKVTSAHTFYAICWKGNSRAINVMCGKIEIDSIKHQLAALKVLR